MKIGATRLTESTRRARRIFGRFAAAGLLAAAFLALWATPSSADHRHFSASYSFGAEGTSGSTIPTLNQLAFQQATKRLYALERQTPTRIHGFSFNGPGSFSLLGGSFPLEPENARLNQPGLAVDNTNLPSAGHIIYSTDCGCPTSFAYAYTSSGEFLFQVGVSKIPAQGGGLEAAQATGIAVDNEGHIWIADESPAKIEEFEPTGGAAIRVIETPVFGNSPRRLAIDPSTDDLYASVNNGVWRLTAASDYSASEATRVDPRGFIEAIAVNGATRRLYSAGSGVNGVRAYDAQTGALIEEFGGGGSHPGIAVDEATDTVFLASGSQSKVEEWRASIVPDVVTGEPVGNAKVTGSVGLAGEPEVSECYFEFGTTTGYGSTQECSPATPYTSDQPNVTAELPGLVEETTYHYRLVAVNSNGLARGEDRTITPTHVAVLRTEPATELERETATLNASFEGTGEDTHYFFEWGSDTNYGNSTGEEDAGVTSGPTSISTALSGLTAGTTYHYRVVAENSKGQSHGQDRSFTTAPAIKGISTDAPTDVETTSATLNGSLDPDGYTTTFLFEYGKTTSYGHTTAVPPGAPVGTQTPGLTQVNAGIAGLEPGATYHFRLVASNSAGTTIGPDETVTTTQPPSIVGVSSTNVTGNSADLTAVINPNGYQTTYYFEYGPTLGYGSKRPISGASIAPGNTPVEVVVPIGGLDEVTYHFRLTTESEWGTVVSEDQTFDFKLPGGCPNHNLRQQTGAGYLPDCRAYELVSPARAGGAFLFAQAPTSAFASDPARFAFAAILNSIPESGEPANGTFEGDLYVASRTNEGWQTRYIGLPGSHSIGMGGPRNEEFLGPASIPGDLTMSRFLVWDEAQQSSVNGGTLEGSYAPYMYNNEGSPLGRLPTNLEEVPGSTIDVSEGGFTGDSRPSPDFSHYVFTTTMLEFAAGGLTEVAPGSAYDNDLEANTVMVVSKTAGGLDIPRDPSAPTPTGPNGKPYTEYIRIPSVSTNGSHVLMSTMASGGLRHLYMRVNDAVSYDISRGQDGENHAVRYIGMTSDGSVVYFTSAEQLTVDDEDASVDLYRWDEEGNEVTRVSTGIEGTGNSDACTATWIEGCDVEVVPTARKSFNGNEPPIDTAIAVESGDIYFYSPEELAGTRGAFAKRNLFVYRGGSVDQMLTLEKDKPIQRIQVTPDGDHVGLITKTRLTAYSNNNASEMYRLDPSNRSVSCVSCRPDGHRPAGDVEGSQNGLFITNDGRTFFSTVDDLVPRDADAIEDVYEYVGGRPQLISSGTADAAQSENQAIGLVGVSADGIDAYFAAVDKLVQQDENGPYLKYYDARTNGGFPYVKPQTPCAAADECHGPETQAPEPLTIGTRSNVGTGNVASKKSKARHRRRRCRRHRKARCRRKTNHRRHHRRPRKRTRRHG